jgi:quercetin dioxygenase-like cupin family protein
MKVVRSTGNTDVPDILVPPGMMPENLATGPGGFIHLHSQPSPDGDLTVGMSDFQDGAVTAWHTHSEGQMLFVMSGHARVGTDSEDAAGLEAGTLIVSPPGERHWHGADASDTVQFLGLSWGSITWSDKPVLPEDE